MRVGVALIVGVVGLVACGAHAAKVDGDAPGASSPDGGAPGPDGSVVSGDAGPTGPDLDQDGIADDLEEQLLHRYRPYYKFSQEGDRVETNGPADCVQAIAQAQLEMMEGDTHVSDPVDGCGEDGDRDLVPPSSLLTCRTDSSFEDSADVTSYCLKLPESFYGGVPIAQAEVDGTGLYGHVVSDTVDGRPAYLIDYWQYYGFNNQDLTVFGEGSFGDHEGDWTGMQVWVDQATGGILKLLYMIHGGDLTFDMPDTSGPTCSSCFETVQGAHWNPDVGSFFDANETPKYNDNQAEFWVDDQSVRHVVLYIERGGHETWPGAWGSTTFSVGPATASLNAHNGLGESYLFPGTLSRPLNLGEVDHPLSDEAALVLQYDGFWGCTNAKDVLGLAPQRRSPVGPSAHCEWKKPNGGANPASCEP